MVHALAVPLDNSGQVEKHDEQVEEIAVRIATAWDQERGATVQDVSKPALARAAGLANWPGFDLLARQSDGAVRSIEVKAAPAAALSSWPPTSGPRPCTWATATGCTWSGTARRPTPYWSGSAIPFAKLLANERASATYAIFPKSLMDAAEPT